jgi:hypothetical protein
MRIDRAAVVWEDAPDATPLEGVFPGIRRTRLGGGRLQRFDRSDHAFQHFRLLDVELG